MENLNLFKIKSQLIESADLINQLVVDEKLINNIEITIELMINCLKNGNKIITAGNGGSASDSQHFVGELISRFNFDRPGLNAISLNTDTTSLTAIANDYGYEEVFKRQLEAIGNKGDIFMPFSTSGESKNIIKALQTTKEGLSIISIGMGGNRESKMKKLCDYYIEVPSSLTPKIQEAHAIIGHIICSSIENQLFKDIA